MCGEELHGQGGDCPAVLCEELQPGVLQVQTGRVSSPDTVYSAKILAIGSDLFQQYLVFNHSLWGYHLD